MKKALILSLVLVLALAAAALAWDPNAKGPRLNYMGYVSKYANGTVDADTLVCVFNPNPWPVAASISLFDKYGNVIKENQLFLDGGLPITTIPPMGLGWITLGMMMPETGAEPMKYPFVITWVRPQGMVPYRGLVAEVKQILYTSPVMPMECWHPAAIKSWAEAMIGKGWGKYGGGPGYSQ